MPVDQAGIDVLRTEIDEIDADLVRLILRRTAVSHANGAAGRSLGGPRIVYSLDRWRCCSGSAKPGVWLVRTSACCCWRWGGGAAAS